MDIFKSALRSRGDFFMSILSLSSPLLSLLSSLSSTLQSDFEPCDWAKRFMQVILTNQIQAVNATSTWHQAGTRLIGDQRRPQRQSAPSNVKPCNYKHDSRKCTEAEINSHITVPGKVHASQDQTKQRVTCSSNNVHMIVCLG